jgi:clan AA aspartic protease (TIGR02281 family)
MEEQGGVYRIPCLVNGAKMKLIFDTGASDVCLSQSIAEYLLDNDYISSSDFVDAGQSIVADGRIVDHLKLKLKDIEINGLHLSNVPAIVIFGQQVPLLLGQSAIQQLGTISLNGNQLIIHQNTSNSITAENADFISNRAMNNVSSGFYDLALEDLKGLYTSVGLNPFETYTYIYVLNKKHNYTDAVNVGTHWLEYYQNDYTQAIIAQKSNIARNVGYAYQGLNDWVNAGLYQQKAITTAPSDWDKDYAYYDLAYCYENQGEFKQAKDAYDNAVVLRMTSLGITLSDIFNDKCQDEQLANYFRYRGFLLHNLNDTDGAVLNIGLSALCGNNKSYDFLRDLGYTLSTFKDKYSK